MYLEFADQEKCWIEPKPRAKCGKTNLVCLPKLNYILKAVFSESQRQDMSPSCFLPKIKLMIGYFFFGGKQLKFITWLVSQKKLTLIVNTPKTLWNYSKLMNWVRPNHTIRKNNNWQETFLRVANPILWCRWFSFTRK